MEKTIKELDIYISDGNYSSKYPRSEEFVEEGVPFIRGNNMVDGEITDDEMYHITPEKHAILLKGHVKSGDVLITTRGNIGQIAIVPDRHEDSNINAQIVLLRPNPETLYNRYLLWALQSHKANEQYLTLQTGTALKQLPVGKLEKLSIVVTNINKQHEIADVLDKTYEVIKLRRKELTLLDDLIKARFVELFGDPVSNPKGWNMVELGELTGIGSSKRIFEKEYVSEGIPFYRTKEIVELSKGNSISTELYITEKRFAEIKKQYGVPKAGDLLISAVGTIGVIWIVDGKNDFYFKDGNLIRVDGSEKFNSVYMKNLLEHLIAEYKKQMSSGTAYAALTISGLTKMKVYDVPMDLQNYFADFVHQVDKSKVAVQKSLDETQQLFDSLMQQYFG